MRRISAQGFQKVELIPLLGFMLLFPGYLIYNSLIGFGYMSSQFSGGFGAVCVVLFAYFLTLVPRYAPFIGSFVGKYELFFVVFLVYAFLWSFFHLLLQDLPYVEEAFYQSIKTIFFWVVLFLLGAKVNLDLHRAHCFMWGFVMLTGLFLAFRLAAAGDGVYVTSKLLLGDGEKVASYQGMARSAQVIVIATLVFATRNSLQRFGVVLVGAFILFALGGRSEFYSFLFLAFILSCMFSRDWGGLRAVIPLWAAMLVAGLFVLYNEHFIFNSRQLEVFNLSQSTSWVARTILMEEAIKEIHTSPLFGNFGAHFAYDHSGGTYAHNVISAWVNYGVVGFVMYLLLVLWGLFISLGSLLNRNLVTRSLVWAFSLSLVSAFLLFTSKSVFWVLPALAWGAVCRGHRKLD